MATKIITRNAAGSVPTVSTGADLNKGSTLTAQEHDQNLVNLRSAVDNALAGTQASLSNTTPLMDGGAQPGAAVTTSRSDHRHPQDTGKEEAQLINTIRYNLGNPTAREAALFKAQYTNKLRFIPPTLIESKATSADDTTWITHPTQFPTDVQVRDAMNGDGSIPTTGFSSTRNYDLRLTWDNTAGNPGYVHLSHLYLYWNPSPHSAKIKIEYYSTTTSGWNTVADTAYIQGWPTHSSVPHTNIPLSIGQKARLTFNVIWSTTMTGALGAYYNDPIKIFTLEWWGGYPAVKRDIYSTDRDRVTTFQYPLATSSYFSVAGSATVGTSLTTGSSGYIKSGGNVAGGLSQNLVLDNIQSTDQSGTAIYMGYQTMGTGWYGIRLAQRGNPSSYRSGDLHIQTHTGGADNLDASWTTLLTAKGTTTNIGIGTVAPIGKLNLTLTAGQPEDNLKWYTQYSLLNLTTPYGTGATFANGITWSSTDGQPDRVKAGIYSRFTAVGSYLYFGTSNTYATGITNNALTINPTGYIGVGITTPTQLLHISSSTTNAYTKIDAPAAYVSSLLFASATVDQASIYRPASTTNQLRIATTSGGDVLTINGGNVGIGTTTPSYLLHVNGAFVATTKSFLIDHPTKPYMKLRHGSLEGPENGVYVRGKLKGSYLIPLPDYWKGLVDENTITVNLTSIGRKQNLYIISILNNAVLVSGEEISMINCFYTIYGERKDVDKMVVEF
jgi:hypothetical protein